MAERFYLISTVCIRHLKVNTLEIKHSAKFTIARSKEEAQGIAYAAIMKEFPINDGWVNHHAIAVDQTEEARKCLAKVS